MSVCIRAWEPADRFLPPDGATAGPAGDTASPGGKTKRTTPGNGARQMKFQVGKTYATRSICDYDCVFSFTVVARTDKTVTIRGANNARDARRKVRVWNGVEQIDPLGRYSMSPVLGADDLIGAA